VTVAGIPAAYQFTKLYQCTADNYSDRCGTPVEVTGFSSTGSAMIASPDPFIGWTDGKKTHTGQVCSDEDCLIYDTEAKLIVNLADFGTGTKTFVNVCSYPSGPGSAYGDCVVTANAGFLTIVKAADPVDQGTFVFNASNPSTNGLQSWTINGSGTVEYIPFMGGSYNLNEVVPAGWRLDSASCAIQTAPPTPTGTGTTVPTTTTSGISGFEIRSGLTTTCTFSNTLLRPALSLVKTATPATYSAVGQAISYSYLVTNSGNVSLLGPVSVADDKATVTCPAGGLVPGASVTCSASYTISQADLDSGSVTNTAKASANGTDSNQDSETVTAAQSPALTLVKTATPTTYDSVGDVVGYSYLVTNSGNVSLLGPVTVADDKARVVWLLARR